jgi:hypothetical protein
MFALGLLCAWGMTLPAFGGNFAQRWRSHAVQAPVVSVVESTVPIIGKHGKTFQQPILHITVAAAWRGETVRRVMTERAHSRSDANVARKGTRRIYIDPRAPHDDVAALPALVYAFPATAAVGCAVAGLLMLRPRWRTVRP